MGGGGGLETSPFWGQGVEPGEFQSDKFQQVHNSQMQANPQIDRQIDISENITFSHYVAAVVMTYLFNLRKIILCFVTYQFLVNIYYSVHLRHNHTERQEERQAAHQASVAEAAAASPMQVYGDASLDAPNGSQIHCINLTLHLPLTLDAPLDARCVYTLKNIQECPNL